MVAPVPTSENHGKIKYAGQILQKRLGQHKDEIKKKVLWSKTVRDMKLRNSQEQLA